MSRYLSLISFTDRGVQEAGESVSRANDFRAKVEAAGGKVHSLYWALGEYDGALIFEARDDKSAASLLLKLGQQGFVRTHTLRLYDATEFQEILSTT